ncbi:fatty acid desaturase [Chromobacterium subtsugae]|uniref:Fatty acid desaturase n=1 Tax=Chromobacterium subtsugae TaxID=251747 RepID=A0ABS7FD66_9NEIS|nr:MULTISPECIES: fatty acid desaturase [Chromobacterium]KUM05131.1 aminotransferase [Chromobacterium subtsugae]KZE88142.1 aminotransferase [Chromobacterium sp. F49]MBW7565686.1 fatty acid desaturase [Chromobacterium subtsugae]MBW8288017.1 fatty acid desaturase [Chromobacterium subtsugae]OBU86849.1 aminotransferase [Chromobacterium subtsugae]
MQLNLLDLHWWGAGLAMLGLTHATIASVTIFLHRHQAHQSLRLHPLASHFFRFWLWLTTGMITREWVAIHRKHHAATDTLDDPHSPQCLGIWRVLLEGSELYRRAAGDQAMLDQYGGGTPDDWLERRLYARHSRLGVSLMLVIDLLLFGPVGLSVWAAQMLWIPIFAAGVINGVGHYWGYRSFATNDSSRNILPLGLLIGGEELHNNHHAYATSAKLSIRWWEFDVGWLYIRLLACLGLAMVRQPLAPLRLNPRKLHCDEGTLSAVIAHRYLVLSRFDHALRRVAAAELRRLRFRLEALQPAAGVEAIRRWLRHAAREPLPDCELLERTLPLSMALNTIYTMRAELASLWERSANSTEQLSGQLEDWCKRAENSGIDGLSEFSRQLRKYDF